MTVVSELHDCIAPSEGRTLPPMRLWLGSALLVITLPTCKGDHPETKSGSSPTPASAAAEGSPAAEGAEAAHSAPSVAEDSSPAAAEGSPTAPSPTKPELPTPPTELEPCATQPFSRYANLNAVCVSLEPGSEQIHCSNERITASMKGAAGGPFRDVWMVCKSDLPVSECAVVVETADGVHAAQIGAGASSAGTWSEGRELVTGRVMPKSALDAPMVRFSLNHWSRPRFPESSLLGEDEPTESVKSTEQWVCAVGTPATCWTWTTKHTLVEILVRDSEAEVEGEPPDEPPEVVETTRQQWRRSFELDVDAGAVLLEVEEGSKGFEGERTERCRLVLSEVKAPSDSSAGAAAFRPETALEAVMPAQAPYDKTSFSLSEVSDPKPNVAVFRSAKGDEIGAAWYVASAGGDELGVLLYGDADDDEHFLRHAATFVRDAGTWRSVDTKPVYGGVDADFASAPSLLELGRGRYGLLMAPLIVGCGAAPCRPKDDFVTNVIHELTPTGVVEVWRFQHFGCEVGSKPPVTRGCTIEMFGPLGHPYRDLRVTTRTSSKRPAQTRSYQHTRDGYRPLAAAKRR